MANATAVDTGKLEGYFKEQYGSSLEELNPEFAIMAEDVPFKRRNRTGRSYNIPVRTRRSFGFTFDNSGGAFALNSAVPSVTREAVFTPTEMTLRENVAYSVLSRAQNSQQAFGDALDDIVEGMHASSAFLREIALIYGGGNIGVVESASGSGGVYEFVISKESWAGGLWSQAEGMPVDLYDTTGATQRNSANDANVTHVDHDTRTVEITGDNTELNAVVATDFIVPKGFKDNVFSGLDTIATNTGSLFGVDGATYGLWKGNTVSAGSAALKLGKVLSAAGTSTVRGGMGKLCMYLSTYSWEDLNNDHAALRRFGEEQKMETVLGTKKISYFGSNGEIQLKPHPMVKAGEAFLYPPEKFERRGSTDITFQGPDTEGGRIFFDLESYNGKQLRCYWDQGLFARNIARCVKINNIVNNSL